LAATSPLQGRRRPATIPAVAIGAWVATASLSASTGCANTLSVARPAAEVAEDGPRFFSPPISIVKREDAIVRIVAPTMTCTGALIAEDVVLTAHHCVVERGENGAFLGTSLDASQLQIELGGEHLAWGAVRARAVVTPPCGEAGGGGDIALLVLTRKLIGVPTLRPRLDDPPRTGEMYTNTGFGRCSTSSGGITRRMRPSGPVRTVGPMTFGLEASVCPGDSGAPVLTQNGEIAGVVSLSAMDQDERTAAPSIMARIDHFRASFGAARMIADGASPAELPPLTCE